MLSLPVGVYSWPWRASRVGATQSNWSMPRSTPANRSSGSPMPSRCRGQAWGTAATDQSITACMSALDLPSEPPMATPSNGRLAMNSALAPRTGPRLGITLSREHADLLANPVLESEAEREHLVATAVGDHGAVPAHEPVQPA